MEKGIGREVAVRGRAIRWIDREEGREEKKREDKRPSEQTRREEKRR